MRTLNPNRWPWLNAFCSLFPCFEGSFSCSSKSSAAPGSGKRGGGATHADSRAATDTGVPIRTMTLGLDGSFVFDIASLIICCSNAPAKCFIFYKYYLIKIFCCFWTRFEIYILLWESKIQSKRNQWTHTVWKRFAEVGLNSLYLVLSRVIHKTEHV